MTTITSGSHQFRPFLIRGRSLLIISSALLLLVTPVDAFGGLHQGTALSVRQHQRSPSRIARCSVAPQTSNSDTPPRRKSNGGPNSSNPNQHHKKKPSNSKGHNRRKTRQWFQSAKSKEKAGRWKEAAGLFTKILQHDPTDAHTHLALARLEAKREERHVTGVDKKKKVAARAAFEAGINKCPNSVHLWQAWARYEESCSDVVRARELFTKALQVEERNPYVCHSFGLMEKKLGHPTAAIDLWEKGLRNQPTAALVCSLAELLIEQQKLKEARHLYLRYLTQVKTEREMTEIYLASAWLEEKYFRNFERAEELIELALVQSPGSGRAQVALARLEGRRSRRQNKSGKAATRKRLSEAVESIENGNAEPPSDGRLFNALAHVEVKSRKFDEARKILEKGIERFPDDVSVSRCIKEHETCIHPLMCSHPDVYFLCHSFSMLLVEWKNALEISVAREPCINPACPDSHQLQRWSHWPCWSCGIPKPNRPTTLPSRRTLSEPCCWILVMDQRTMRTGTWNFDAVMSRKREKCTSEEYRQIVPIQRRSITV
jgi:tetratricopeptide (TPR) repeat protein